MLFARLWRILKLDRLGRRGPRVEFPLAATAHNLRKLAKLILHAVPATA